MADDLRVQESSGEAPVSAEADKPKDRGREQLERLREIAKARHGKVLSDKQLVALVERHQEKLLHEHELAESKAAFESELGQEQLTNRQAEVKAQKATGTEKARGADGLSETDRQLVRGDPKAGPKLPPAASKAATPEQ